MNEERTISSGDLLFYMNGNKDAVEFCSKLLFIAHLWDDLIDKDKIRTDAEINSAFTYALVDIPCNAFFIRFCGNLLPLMRNVIIQWKAANKMERSPDNDEKIMAFLMRNELLNLLSYCLVLVGGEEWEKQVGIAFRKMIGKTFNKKAIEFFKEMQNA